MEKVRVLHYAPGFNLGGIESRLLDWYRNIDREKVQFCLIKLNNLDDTRNIKEFKELGGEVYNLPALNSKNAWRYIKELSKLFSENRFDVIHVHDISSGIFPLIFSWVHGIKLRILHSRTTSFLPDEKNLILKTLLKKIVPLFANEYFSCSHEAGVWVFGEKSNFKVIKNGIQEDYFRFKENIRCDIRNQLKVDNKKVIGSISRLSPQKNLYFLIDIFNEVCKKDSDVVLVLVGDGILKQELIQKIQQLNLENRVILAGEKKNVWDYYMAFDVFLATSFYEGFGTTAIESQAVGVPTILSKGFPEIVCITPNTKRISLDESLDYWTEELIQYLETPRMENNINLIIEAGYSAKNVAQELQSIYLAEKK